MSAIEALIIDDSMSARFALNRSLQSHDIEVSQAKSGEEGVEQASQKAYDIIFMDHVLPGISGLDAMEKIRQQGINAQTPIIMCTSNDDAAYRAEAEQRGANGVLCKPPDAQALSDLLQRLMPDESADVAMDELASSSEAANVELPITPAPGAQEPGIEPSPSTFETEAAQATEQPAGTSESMSNDKLDAIDQRLDRLESLLERLESHVTEMDNRSKAMARAIADQAGRDLSNRLLRAVLTLKGK